jgi:hypothetical protein
MATAIDTSAITGLLVGLSVALTSLGVVNRGPNGRRSPAITVLQH